MLAFFILLCSGPLRAFAGEAAAPPATQIYNKAVRLFEKHKWAAAKEHFHQYLAEYSDTPLYITCLYYLAFCYQQLDDTQQAIIIYHKVMEQAHEVDAFWAQMAERRVRDIRPQPES